MNVDAAWRMALAQRAARVYAENGKLAAFSVASSVGPAWPTGSPIWNWTATGWTRQMSGTGPYPSAPSVGR